MIIDDSMVEYPPGKPQAECAICGEPFESYDPEFASGYANLVCEACDERAVTAEDDSPKYGNGYLGRDTIIDDDSDTPTIRMVPDVGDNLVFIDRQKCWRRYRFGGWITRRDDYDCASIEEFHERHQNNL